MRDFNEFFEELKHDIKNMSDEEFLIFLGLNKKFLENDDNTKKEKAI